MAILVVIVGGVIDGMAIAWAFAGVAGMFFVFAFTLDESR